MLFNSITFAVFLPIVFILYWLCPSKYRWALLLITSYYFYMGWNVKYVLLIFATTLVSYACGVLVEKSESHRKKKVWVIVGCAVIFGILFLFKYFNFFMENLNAILSRFFIQTNEFTLKLILPVGISFYTFQTVSYIMDVYHGEIPAEKHFGYYAAFVSFFPQLVAGPIERASNLLPQLKAEHGFKYEKASYGVKLMAVGYFKKIVIADALAKYVDLIFADVFAYRGVLLVGALFFTLQIYCDFSGYSDIAVGTAKLFDIDLMNNFKSPYFSVSIHDFWRRWHISLSTFFRDYVYIPLGGNRCGKIRNSVNLIITFLLSGLWHGASWNYVCWGGLHGVLQIAENMLHLKTYEVERKWLRYIRVTSTFFVIVITWIFFRTDIQSSLYVIANMFQGVSNPITYITAAITGIGADMYSLVTLAVLLLLLLIYDYLSLKRDVLLSLSGCSREIRWIIYVVFVVLICVFSQKGEAAEFVYFQF